MVDICDMRVTRIAPPLALCLGLLVLDPPRARGSEPIRDAIGACVRASLVEDDVQVSRAIDEILSLTARTDQVEAALGRRELTALARVAGAGDLGAEAASSLLRNVRPVRKPPVGDAAEVVERILGRKTYSEQTELIDDLRGRWGQYLIPFSMSALDDENPERRVSSFILVIRMSRHVGIEPLAEALLASDDSVGFWLARALASCGNPEGRATLAEMVERTRPGSAERSRYARALEDLSQGGDRSAAELFLAKARAEYDVKRISQSPPESALWRYRGVLEFTNVPRILYGVRMAERHVLSSLRNDPGSKKAQRLLVRILASRELIVECAERVGIRGAETGTDTTARIGAMGWRVIAGAIEDSLDEGDYAVASRLLATLPRVLPSMALRPGLGIVESLRCESVPVRVAALRMCATLEERVQGVREVVEAFEEDHTPAIRRGAHEALRRMDRVR